MELWLIALGLLYWYKLRYVKHSSGGVGIFLSLMVRCTVINTITETERLLIITLTFLRHYSLNDDPLRLFLLVNKHHHVIFLCTKSSFPFLDLNSSLKMIAMRHIICSDSPYDWHRVDVMTCLRRGSSVVSIEWQLLNNIVVLQKQLDIDILISFIAAVDVFVLVLLFFWWTNYKAKPNLKLEWNCKCT